MVDRALGDGHPLLEPEPHRENTREDVAAHMAAQLAGDGGGDLVADVLAEVLVEGGDGDRAALGGGLPQPGGQLGVGRVVVGARHRQHRVRAPAFGRHLGVVAERAADPVRHQQDVQAVVVAVEEELGADLGAVRRTPVEGVAVDGAGHPAPQRRVLDARARQDLRHLRDVAEHVREIADRHRTAQVGRGGPAHPEVADDGLA